MSETISLPTNVQVGNILTTNQGIAEQVRGVGAAVAALVPIFTEQVEALKQIALKEGAYVTLAVTAATLDGVTVTGQTVSYAIFDEATGQYVTQSKTFAYNGEAVAIPIPYKAKYRVWITDTLTTRQDGLYDHFAPSVATGTALIDTAVTLTYLDGEHITTFAEMQAARDAMAAQYEQSSDAVRAGQTSLVGVEIADTWVNDDETATYDDPMVCVDFDFYEDEDGTNRLHPIMQRKWATLRDVAFNTRNQEIATEETAQEGLYYYGMIAAAHDQAHGYASSEYCLYDGQLWRAKAAIAANTAWDESKWESAGYTGANVADYDEETEYVARSIVAYDDGYVKCAWRVPVKNTKTNIAITSITGEAPNLASGNWELVTFDAPDSTAGYAELSLSTGVSVPYSSYFAIFKTPLTATNKNYVRQTLRYGHNRYRDSDYRQYLNSDADIGEWWSQKHVGQIPTGATYNYRGYLAGCSAALRAAMKKVKVTAFANPYTDGGNNVVDAMYDLMWLPSGTQMLGNVNANEGHFFPYWARIVCEAIEAHGGTVVHYDTDNPRPDVGAVGVAYANDETGHVYVWRGDTLAYTGTVVNDDGAFYRDQRTKTITEYAAYADFPTTGSATGLYFDQSTQKMWQWKSNAYADISGDYYIYLATKGWIDLARIQRRTLPVGSTSSRSAANCRLRSAYRNYAYNAWNVYTTGNLGSNTAYYAFASVPACAI